MTIKHKRRALWWTGGAIALATYAFVPKWYLVAIVWLLCFVIDVVCLRSPKPKIGKWEAVSTDDGTMWRVRWSLPDRHGRFLFVRHYGGNSPGWDQHACERNAEQFNRDRRSPYEWEGWEP